MIPQNFSCFTDYSLTMGYLGSKAQTAGKFAPILVEAMEGATRFVEPFVGNFCVLPAMRKAGYNPSGLDFCADAHQGVTTMWSAIQDGWEGPTSISEAEYKELRATCDWTEPLYAFAAYGCSFGAKEWGGYARDSRDYNYAAGHARAIERKRPYLSKGDVEFSFQDYQNTEVSHGDIVYCDPPYQGVTGYSKTVGSFDSDVFADWVDDIAQTATVFVSEFTQLRPHWEEVWSRPRALVLRGKIKSDAPVKVERLFRIISR